VLKKNWGRKDKFDIKSLLETLQMVESSTPKSRIYILVDFEDVSEETFVVSLEE
jgi:hypothetical protein